MTSQSSRAMGPTVVVGLVLALLGACGSERTPEPERPTRIESAPVTLPTEDTVPVTHETIVIEGVEEQIEVVPFEAPLDFPKTFATMVPRDMVVEFVSSGEGDVIRFEAAFGGVHRREALLSFNVLPEGTTGDSARQLIRDLATARGGSRRVPANFTWADDEWAISPAGFIALAQHGTRWFYFLAEYPAEFGEGMGPRTDLILRRWVFTSDGTPLLSLQ